MAHLDDLKEAFRWYIRIDVDDLTDDQFGAIEGWCDNLGPRGPEDGIWEMSPSMFYEHYFFNDEKTAVEFKLRFG